MTGRHTLPSDIGITIFLVAQGRQREVYDYTSRLMQEEGHWTFWENYLDLIGTRSEMMVRIRRIISQVCAGGVGSSLVGNSHCKWAFGCSGCELKSYGYPFPLSNGEPVGALKSFPTTWLGRSTKHLDPCLPSGKLTHSYGKLASSINCIYLYI